MPAAPATTPVPLTDLGGRVNDCRALILAGLTEVLGPVDLAYDFFREWNGCWKARVDISGTVTGCLEFTLLVTPAGGLLALPRPLPERWRREFGIAASDGSRWTLDDAGDLERFEPR